MRRSLIVLLVFALLGAACTSSDSTTTTTAPPGSTSPTTTTVPGTTVPGTSTTGDTSPPATGDVDPGIAEALRAEIEALVEATEEVRGLAFITPPQVTVITTAQLAQRIRDDLEEDLIDLEVEQRLFRLFGLLDSGTDLRQLVEDLLAEQVLGFYDDETGEMVVAGESADLSVLSRLTVVHELIHALTDQHFGFGATFDMLDEQERFDEAAALQALVEGDATYFQVVYLQEKLSFAEQLELANEVLEADTTVLDASPEWLQADLAFPYDDGFRFVERLVQDGGIAAVDRAYTQLPVTTEQILHPERYQAGEPAGDVTLPETPLAGWDIYEESSLGEWGLSLLFIGTLDRGRVTQVGDGWLGDRYRILTRGDDVAFVLRYQGEREEDALDVTQAFLALARGPMGLGEGLEAGGGIEFSTEQGYAFVDREGRSLVVIAATDATAGTALRASVVP